MHLRASRLSFEKSESLINEFNREKQFQPDHGLVQTHPPAKMKLMETC